MATYSHLPSSDLLAGYTLSSPVSNFQFQVSKSYEPHRDLITQVRNETAVGVISQYDYASDALGRRVSRHDSGLAFAQSQTNAFGYNQRSEVTSAVMYTNSYGYVFDPIGNRLFSSVNAETNTYAANALNQYSNVVVHPSSLILHPLYDADGNMTATGDGWHYGWNGENRLVLASNATHIVTYAYDHQGRMVSKVIDGAPRSYLWDGYNIVSEKLMNSGTNELTNFYVWGLDLSGTLQGAAGVGGLLAATFNGTNVVYCYDANGNVTELLDAYSGAVLARYRYGAFGETLVSEGPLASANPWRFSTRYHDDETGLVMFPRRPYSPDLGRFLSRDPIEEKGGFNLYRFVNNNPVNMLDVYGLGIWNFKADWEQTTKSVDVTVTYTLDVDECKCCEEAIIDRYVKKFLGVWGGPYGPFVLDHGAEGGFCVKRGTQVIAHAEGDSPDGQGWPYHFPWTQRFLWKVKCTKGALTGQILSTEEKSYHTTGHWQGDRYSGTFE